MVNGLGIGASAMNAQSEPLSVLANNRANSAAAGFKAEHLSFIQLLTSPPAAGSVSLTDPAVSLPSRQGIVDPPRVDALKRDGRTRFLPPPDLDLCPARNVHVRQGAIGQSNVNPVLTLVEMIDAMRVYEASQRAGRDVAETLSHAVNDVGRV